MKECRGSLLGLLDDISDAVSANYEQLIGGGSEAQEPGSEPSPVDESSEQDGSTSRFLVNLGRQYSAIGGALWTKFQAEVEALSPRSCQYDSLQIQR